MELERTLMLILVFGVAGFAGMVNSLCLMRNSVETGFIWYQCSMSNNYSSDVEAAPIDVQMISFSNSEMAIIKNGSFARLGSGLEVLQIYYSEIGGIEDNAFEGLDKLIVFEVGHCNLQTIKGAWFKGLKNLKAVLLLSNGIERIEDSFFSTVPPLYVLDISQNKLNCLSVERFGGFDTREFRVGGNYFTLMCRIKLQKWLNDQNILNSYTEQTNLEMPSKLLDMCVEQQPTDHPDEKLLQKCVEVTLLSYLLPQANYTIEQLCKSLEKYPSPFVDCSM